MLTELVLTSSSTEPIIHVWDFRTGTLVTTFKQNVCNKHGLALIPFPGQPDRVGLIIASQVNKALLHVYSWQKDQIHLKIICPEKLNSLAVTNQGSHCAGGTDNGKIYVWELSTGRLCRVFDAHYKKINVLKFTYDDTALISGSEDAGLNVWLMSRQDEEESETLSPYYSLPDHSLPITDIICGIGSFNKARILSSSLDHTCKLWDLSTGYLLTTFVFPTVITAITIDPAERILFAGGKDNLIYQVNLYRRKFENKMEITSIGGDGIMEDIISSHNGNHNNNNHNNGLTFRGHTSPITMISLSYDATLLLSGSQDGNVRVWDIDSRQMIKSFNHHKGPITSLRTFLKPPDLFKIGLSMNKSIIQPIQPFKRIQQRRKLMQSDDSEEFVTLILNDNIDNVFDVTRYDGYDGQGINGINSPEFHDLVKERKNQRQFRTGDETNKLQIQVSELQSELLRIHGHYQRVKGLHDEMYQELVSDFMSKRRERN